MADADTTLRFRAPATTWTDALPLGNGRLGAMCFGGVERDRFQLNETTCWSGSPGAGARPIPDGPAIVAAARAALADGDVHAAEETLRSLQGGHCQAFQPLADLWVEQRRPDDLDGYLRHLDLRTAVASHSFHTRSARVSQEAWISAPAGALIVRRRVQQTHDLPLRLRLDSPHPTAVVSPTIGGLDLVVRMPSDVAPDEVRYDGAAVTAVVGLRVICDGVMTVADDGLRLDGAGEVLLIVGAATDYIDPATAPHGEVDALREALDEKLAGLAESLVRPGGYASLRSAHERAHARLFGRVGLRLGPADAAVPLDTADRAPDPSLAALQFQYGRYLLIASSRPGGLPANLQGLWNDSVRPPWNSNYTTNINLEMNYWPAEVANLSECATPLFDWLGHAERLSPAQRLYGRDGWTLHHNSDAWCFNLPSGTGDDDACWSCWPLAAVWLARHAAEHYAYGRDRSFLAETGWPLLRAAATFALDWLVEEPDGTLGTSPSTSPENHFRAADGRPAAVTVSTTADRVLIRDLLQHVVELGADDPVVARARAALDRLRPERIGADGRLAEWPDDVADTEPEHRHTSHLIGLYPGDSIDPDRTPELAEAARRSLDARGPESTGWSLAWRIALRARLRDAEGAHAMVRRFLEPAGPDRSGVYRNLFCAHPPFQIDGNFGFTAGVAEMLLQSHRSTAGTTSIHLLPALPAAWSEGQFAGLRARGGVTVDATWSHGAVQEVRLVSDSDRRIVVRAGERQVETEARAGVPATLSLRPARQR